MYKAYARYSVRRSCTASERHRNPAPYTLIMSLKTEFFMSLSLKRQIVISGEDWLIGYVFLKSPVPSEALFDG